MRHVTDLEPITTHMTSEGMNSEWCAGKTFPTLSLGVLRVKLDDLEGIPAAELLRTKWRVTVEVEK